MRMSGSPNKLQVVVTIGLEDLARAELALQSALAAACSAVEVHVFLTLRGSIWGCTREFEGEAAGVAELIDRLLELGVTIESCSKCVEAVCVNELDLAQSSPLKAGIEPAGLVTFTTRAVHTPTLTF